MKQLIAVIVTACLILSSCSAEKIKPVIVPMNSITVAPTVENVPFKAITIPQQFNVVSPTDANCMAKAIYYEARGEPMAGKVAIGFVILNRTKMSSYPNTVCGVVKQYTYIRNKKYCQFSWYCKGGDSKINDHISNASYDVCYATAVAVLTNMVDNKVDNAVSFHIRHINAGWAKNGMKLVTIIGNHMFFK